MKDMKSLQEKRSFLSQVLFFFQRDQACMLCPMEDGVQTSIIAHSRGDSVGVGYLGPTRGNQLLAEGNWLQIGLSSAGVLGLITVSGGYSVGPVWPWWSGLLMSMHIRLLFQRKLYDLTTNFLSVWTTLLWLSVILLPEFFFWSYCYCGSGGTIPQVGLGCP